MRFRRQIIGMIYQAYASSIHNEGPAHSGKAFVIALKIIIKFVINGVTGWHIEIHPMPEFSFRHSLNLKMLPEIDIFNPLNPFMYK